MDYLTLSFVSVLKWIDRCDFSAKNEKHVLDIAIMWMVKRHALHYWTYAKSYYNVVNTRVASLAFIQKFQIHT